MVRARSVEPGVLKLKLWESITAIREMLRPARPRIELARAGWLALLDDAAFVGTFPSTAPEIDGKLQSNSS